MLNWLLDKMAIRTGGAALVLVAAFCQLGCETKAQTGAAAGAGAGALIGQAVGGNTKGTLIGAAVGTGVGYMIGNEADKKEAREETARRQQPNYTPPPCPLTDTRWTMVSMNPNPDPQMQGLVVHFRPDGQVTATKTLKGGEVRVENETYRVVGDTLIINKPGYLINARYKIDGNQLIVNCDKFSGVFRKV